jgi:FMN phosphatase YigB (HAD superfamily)
MMITNYLFDLDGTLLPLNETEFLNKYIKLIGYKFLEMGFNPKEMIDKLWLGTDAMIKNNGEKTNEEVFWEVFYPEKSNQANIKTSLEKFYLNEFNQVKDTTTPNEYAKRIISLLKMRNSRIILATNPLFPRVATNNRINWAGLTITDFACVTTYENSSYTKPNLNYYRNILEKNSLNPEETIMIGNDVDEDMVAKHLGLKTFLVTDCLNNRKGKDIKNYHKGSLKDLYEYLLKNN